MTTRLRKEQTTVRVGRGRYPRRAAGAAVFGRQPFRVAGFAKSDGTPSRCGDAPAEAPPPPPADSAEASGGGYRAGDKASQSVSASSRTLMPGKTSCLQYILFLVPKLRSRFLVPKLRLGTHSAKLRFAPPSLAWEADA